MTLAERIARVYAGKWSTANKKFRLPEKKRVDLIMKATHGATLNRLAHGSSATIKEVAFLRQTSPGVPIFFSTYTNNPGSGHTESVLTRSRIPATHIGSVLTTSAEAIALRKCLDANGFEPKTMIVVTDEFNSWRTLDIYQVFFPKTEIWIVAIPVARTLDSESPIINFRNLNRAIWWETLIPMIPFWILTHTGKYGKSVLVWMANRIRQTSA